MTVAMRDSRSSIPESQNLEPNLVLRRAIAQTYYLAKRNFGAQAIVTIAIPTASALASFLIPELRPFVAVISIAAVLIDILYLDRRQKTLLRSAATISERFDCAVLEIPWNKILVGARTPEAFVRERATEYWERVGNDDRLRDWYPASVGKAPLHLARIICQLTNTQYDGRLRSVYRIVVGIVVASIVLSVLFISLLAKLSLVDFILVTLTPTLPLLLWTCRELVRQIDTDAPLRDNQERALEFWSEAVGDQIDHDEYQRVSRGLQDAIFAYRARSPLPIPFVYGALRKWLEAKMYSSADDRLREAGINLT